MSTLKQLLNQYCPDGVDYVRMGDVVKIRNGKDWKDQEAGTVAVYGSGGKMSVTVSSAAAHGPSVLLPRKGSLDVQFVEGPFWNIDTVFRTETNEDKLNPKFFYYAALGLDLESISSSSTRPSLTQTALNNLEIPLPPREVQDKIVEYIDTFAAVCDNLEAEIAQREKQFDAYKELLFSTLEEYEPLSLHGVFCKGKGIQKKDFQDSGHPAFHYGQIHTKYGFQTAKTAAFVSDDLFEKSAYAQPGDLVIATTSEDDDAVGKAVAWMGHVPAAVGGDAHFYQHDFDARFISYFFATHSFSRQKMRLLTGAKVRRISAKALGKIEAPVPPLSIQEDIADKLDTMQELIDNLKHERELRGKQFEFYRSRLLDFTAKESEDND